MTHGGAVRILNDAKRRAFPHRVRRRLEKSASGGRLRRQKFAELSRT